MIGFSFYMQDAKAEEQLEHAASLGVKRAFTSLHIPEEAEIHAGMITHLLKKAATLGVEVSADVSRHTFKLLGIKDFEQLADYGVKGIRLDDDFDAAAIRKLSIGFAISINASTLSERELLDVLETGIPPDRLYAWHNFYPRRETGLDQTFFNQQNELFRRYNIRTAGFIPGKGKKRGPLEEGLPTLEKHRDMNPYAAGIELLYAMDDVYIGDPGTERNLLENLQLYTETNTVRLQAETSFPSGTYQLRPDLSRDVHRLKGTRTTNDVPPANCRERTPGTITMDNDRYGRYKGEVQICRAHLPPDERVNVIGRIIEEDLPLVELLKPSQTIQLITKETPGF